MNKLKITKERPEKKSTHCGLSPDNQEGVAKVLNKLNEGVK